MAYRQRKRKPITDRFWSKVDIALNGDCWEWTGTKQSQGYGMISTERRGHPMLAHRISLQLSGVDVPSHLHVLHKCDNPGCIRPDHLFLGTAHDNALDMCEKRRQHRPVGEKHPKCKLSEHQVKHILDEIQAGASLVEIAERYLVHPTTINDIKQRRTWRHLAV